ncbi:MAG: hypothetical protein HQL88_09380, partial [Magnetococcales bacterium]|nr:hypothetical protein [Magnetococcales bacterium]
MNAIPKKFLFILMDLGLSLLFLVIILVAVLDFNNRLKQEELHARHPAPNSALAGNLAQLQKQKEALASQVGQNRAELQELWDKNAILTAELRKKNAEARKLLEDNMALMGQNASLMVRLNQDAQQAATQGSLPSPAGVPDHGQASTAEESPQAQALRQENATLVAQLAQMNATLQRLHQQKADQPQTTAAVANPSEPGPRPTPIQEQPATAQESAEAAATGFWDKMVAHFQETPRPPAATADRSAAENTPPQTGKPHTPEPSPAQQGAEGGATPGTGEKRDGVTTMTGQPAASGTAVGGTNRNPPAVALEKEMLAPGVLDRLATSFQGGSPPAAAVLSAANPVGGGKLPSPASDTGAKQAVGSQQSNGSSDNKPEGGEDAGFWNRLLNSFQESPRSTPSTVEVAVALPPATPATPSSQAEKAAGSTSAKTMDAPPPRKTVTTGEQERVPARSTPTTEKQAEP